MHKYASYDHRMSYRLCKYYRCKNHYSHKLDRKILQIALTKVAGAFRKANGMRLHVQTP